MILLALHVPQEYWVAIAVTITNTLLTLIGWGMRKTYLIIKHFVEQHEAMYEDLRRTMGVVDTHTTLWHRTGWSRGLNIPTLIPPK